MIKVKLEIWMPLGRSLGKDFQTLSEMHSIWEREIEDGVTVGKFFNKLAENYQPIREKIFERARSRFYPDAVVTLNNQIINPHELHERVLKEGDNVTVFSILQGG